MGRREDIKEQLDKDYELLKEYENTLRTEIDPRLKLKWKEDIKEVKQRIREYEEELRSLSVSSVQPEPVTSELEQRLSTPTIPSDEVELRSERGVDYTKLRDLLAAGKWKDADQETAKVMCQAAGRESEGWLDVEDIDNFPCEDLRTINQLWLHYSDGKFGFSVQKEIYYSLGGTRQYNKKIWRDFGEQVGWRRRGGFLGLGGGRLGWKDLTFSLNAPWGHLPSEGSIWDDEACHRNLEKLRKTQERAALKAELKPLLDALDSDAYDLRFSRLFSRAKTCNL